MSLFPSKLGDGGPRGRQGNPPCPAVRPHTRSLGKAFLHTHLMPGAVLGTGNAGTPGNQDPSMGQPGLAAGVVQAGASAGGV